MATTYTEMKRWTIDAEWTIVKTRDDSDGEIAYEIHNQGVFADASDTLEGAREFLREQKNQITVTEIYDLLGDIESDLGARGAQARLAAVLEVLKK